MNRSNHVSSRVVLIQKRSLSDNQGKVFSPHNHIHPLQNFEVEVGIDSSTLRNEPTVNNILKIPPDAEHPLVSKTSMLGDQFWKLVPYLTIVYARQNCGKIFFMD